MFLQLSLLLFTLLCFDFTIINHQEPLSYDFVGRSCDEISLKPNGTRKIVRTPSGARINYKCNKVKRWFPNKCILNVKRKNSRTKSRYLKFDLLSTLPRTKNESSPKLWEMYRNNCSTRNKNFVLCACNLINKFINSLPKLKDKWAALRVLNRFATAKIGQLKKKTDSDREDNNGVKESFHRRVIQSVGRLNNEKQTAMNIATKEYFTGIAPGIFRDAFAKVIGAAHGNTMQQTLEIIGTHSTLARQCRMCAHQFFHRFIVACSKWLFLSVANRNFRDAFAKVIGTAHGNTTNFGDIGLFNCL